MHKTIIEVYGLCAYVKTIVLRMNGKYIEFSQDLVGWEALYTCSIEWIGQSHIFEKNSFHHIFLSSIYSCVNMRVKFQVCHWSYAYIMNRGLRLVRTHITIFTTNMMNLRPNAAGWCYKHTHHGVGQSMDDGATSVELKARKDTRAWRHRWRRRQDGMKWEY